MKNNNRFLNALYYGADGLVSLVKPKTPPHLLLACPRKSASTFIATAISELPGFKRYRLIPDWGASDQQLSTTRLSRYNRRQYIAQHHLKNSAWTQKLIAQYGLTPIVTVRDFADSAVSLKDHHLSGPEGGRFFDKAQRAMSEADFEEAVVRVALPWYFDFYAGWLAAGNVPIYDFDDYTSDPVKTIVDITNRVGLDYRPEIIEAAVEKATGKFIRFNVGKAGRGRNLSPQAKEAMLQLMRLYPGLQDTPLFIKTYNTINTPAD